MGNLVVGLYSCWVLIGRFCVSKVMNMHEIKWVTHSTQTTYEETLSFIGLAVTLESYVAYRPKLRLLEITVKGCKGLDKQTLRG